MLLMKFVAVADSAVVPYIVVVLMYQIMLFLPFNIVVLASDSNTRLRNIKS